MVFIVRKSFELCVKYYNFLSTKKLLKFDFLSTCGTFPQFYLCLRAEV